LNSGEMGKKRHIRLPAFTLAAVLLLLTGLIIIWLDSRLDFVGLSSNATPTPTAASTRLVPVVPGESIQLSPLNGKPAPDFSLRTLDGKTVQLSDFKGKAVLINLWATWCPPCQAEMPAIQAAYVKYKDQGLVVLAVNFTVQDTLPDITAFVGKYHLDFPVLLDEDGAVSSNSYGMRGLPDSYFIDRTGVVRRMVAGAIPTEQLDQFILEIMAPSGPA
jgi:peroxiredoxin